MAVADSPADGYPQSVQLAFAKLCERFVAGLPQRWQEIEEAGTGPALEAALHRLAGAAASYGLARVGEAARQAEALARAQSVPARPVQAAGPAFESSVALTTALAELRRCIDEAVTVR